MIGFGLDLAGFTNEKGTVLAKIESDGDSADVELLSSSPFGAKLQKNNFDDRIKREANTLEDLLKAGPVAVDVPIDLQGLPFCKAPTESWELDKREIDKVVGGLPPFASWLGSCVTRFQALLTDVSKKKLGTSLFEAYPRASLERIFGKTENCVSLYKSPNKEKVNLAKLARKELCGKLNIRTNDSNFSHDEIDAVICAVTAVANRNDLVSEREFELKKSNLPLGYRILARNPFREIRVRMINYEDWAQKN